MEVDKAFMRLVRYQKIFNYDGTVAVVNFDAPESILLLYDGYSYLIKSKKQSLILYLFGQCVTVGNTDILKETKAPFALYVCTRTKGHLYPSPA